MCEETPCQRIAEISQGVGTVSGVRRSANHALPQMEMDRAGQGWTGLDRAGDGGENTLLIAFCSLAALRLVPFA